MRPNASGTQLGESGCHRSGGWLFETKQNKAKQTTTTNGGRRRRTQKKKIPDTPTNKLAPLAGPHPS